MNNLWELLFIFLVSFGIGVVMAAAILPDPPPPAHQACRHMDGIPVITPDSGVVCVTSAIQVADTVVPEYVVGDSTP